MLTPLELQRPHLDLSILTPADEVLVPKPHPLDRLDVPVDDELLVLARRPVVNLDSILSRTRDNLARVELDRRDGEIVLERVDDTTRS